MLGVTLLITGIRAWVRRGLARAPPCVSIPTGKELVWVALRTLRNDWERISTLEAHSNPSDLWRDCQWEILTGFIKPQLADSPSIHGPAFLNNPTSEVRHMLTVASKYMRQLDQLSGQEFVLGFTPNKKQCPEGVVIANLISTQPNSTNNNGDDSNRAHSKQDVVRPSHGHEKKLLCSQLAEEGEEWSHGRKHGVDKVRPVIRRYGGRGSRSTRRRCWRHSFDDLTCGS